MDAKKNEYEEVAGGGSFEEGKLRNGVSRQWEDKLRL